MLSCCQSSGCAALSGTPNVDRAMHASVPFEQSGYIRLQALRLRLLHASRRIYLQPQIFEI